MTRKLKSLPKRKSLFSVITPVHPPHFRYLNDAYATLCEQTCEDWEWIIAPQGEGAPIPTDKRIKVHPVVFEGTQGTYPRIGQLKRFCADRAEGEIIVEFDADDLLHPMCLLELKAAFNNDKTQFAYSNNARFAEGTWKSDVFVESFGWKSRPVEYKGRKLNEILHFPANPQSLRSVLFSPDHVRAWRNTAYKEIGGHDSEIQNGDDHDLLCRTYLAYGSEGMKHLQSCLYFYRCHSENTCQKHNPDVFAQVERNYCKYRSAMVTRWAKDNGLRLLDLGGRFNAWPEYEVVDVNGDARKGDIITDLNERWPFDDSSVGVLRASHILEHLHDPIHTMNEAYRVLAPGGWFLIDVPSTDGRGAFQDPTHVSHWNSNSFWYYTNQSFARFIQPAYKGRFQKARVIDWQPTQFERTHNIWWTQADLICLKPPYDQNAPGEKLI